MNLRKFWRRLISAAPLAASAVPLGHAADVTLGPGTRVEFASVEVARRILTERDAFVQALSPFDRASRLKTADEVSEEMFLGHLRDSVVPWTDAAQAKVAQAFSALAPKLVALQVRLPPVVHVIETTGEEEGGAAYTRGSAIVVTGNDLAGNSDRLTALLAHELFHVATRADAAMRERTYAAIGFARCGEIVFPAALAARKITNPDAPANDHCIRVDVNGTPTWVVPILFSRQLHYDPVRGGQFFDYLQFKLLAIDWNGPGDPRPPRYDPSRPQLVDVTEAGNFFEQVGRNTDYIIHPEEILADNFRLLMTDGGKAVSPGVLDKVRRAVRPP